MTCTSCGGKMQLMSTALWCPRCGTLTDDTTTHVPMLVVRTRNFAETLDREEVIDNFECLGLAEAVLLPSDPPPYWSYRLESENDGDEI